MKMLNDELSLDRWIAVDRTVRDVVRYNLYWEMRQLFDDAYDRFESLRDELDAELALRGY